MPPVQLAALGSRNKERTERNKNLYLQEVIF
jgi:hypothetical protein